MIHLNNKIIIESHIKKIKLIMMFKAAVNALKSYLYEKTNSFSLSG